MLSLNGVLDLELYLDPESEAPGGAPCLHLYLSTHVSEEYAVIDLKKEHEAVPVNKGAQRWRLRLNKLEFKVGLGPGAELKLARETSGKSRTLSAALLETTKLNIDIFSHIKSNHGESVLNKAGRICIPLARIIAGSGDRGEVVMPHVFKRLERIKGMHSVTESSVSLDGVALACSAPQAEAIAARMRKDWLKVQQATKRYVATTSHLFDSISNTTEKAKNINSDIWVSPCGSLPALYYGVDVTRPHYTEEYYVNGLQIVLARLGMSRAEFLALSDMRMLACIGGQLMCLFIVYCVYRTDMAFVAKRLANGQLVHYKVGTDEWGDLDVDSLTGESNPDEAPGSDCEDFARNIVRHFMTFTTQSFKDAALEKLKGVLLCYYPFMALLGVGGAEITEDTVPEVKGAHENCILIPKQLAYEMMARHSPARFKEWRAGLAKEEDAFFERSKLCPVLVLEGTGPMWPVGLKEPNTEMRQLLEDLMEKELFNSWKRWHYFEEGMNTNFILLLVKLFCPQFIREGYNFGAFLACHQDPRSKALRKGVQFGDFTARKCEEMLLVMEPEFTREEKELFRNAMCDLHPVPGQHVVPPSSAYYTQVDAIMNEFLSRLRKEANCGSSKEIDPIVPLQHRKRIVYFLRKSKVDRKLLPMCRQLFIKSLPPNTVIAIDMYPERVTHNVGGYRMEFTLDSNRVSEALLLYDDVFAMFGGGGP